MIETFKISMSPISSRLTQPSANRTLALVAIAVVVAIAVFSGALFSLLHRYTTQEEYSHGFLIPVVSAWLTWTRRDAIRASIGRPSWIGVALIVLALIMHVVGELSAIFILSHFAFVIALLGIVLAAGGYSLLRVTFIPIVFLVFAIPLPYFVDSILTLQLQLISSELGAFFIRLFQIPVYLDGNIIDLGNYKLAVVEACSGLRYLYPLLSLSFLAAYLFQAPMWQRAVVFLSAIPITIVMNGFRIGMVGVLVNRWGTQQAEGLLHLFEGWVIFIACAMLLAAEIYVLARFSGKAMFSVFHAPQLKARSLPGSVGILPITACLALLLASGLAVPFITHRTEIVPERTRFVEFPARLGAWQGRTATLDADIERGLGLNDYILSDYRGPDNKAVNFYVAYYTSQRQGESPHSPIVCIPGGGWQIATFERTSSAVGTGTQLPFNRVVIAQNGVKQVVYYWFDERGRKIANEWWSKWYLLTDAIFKNRTDGALVRLVTQVLPGETESDADRRLHTFMREVVPALTAYLPSDQTLPIRSALNRL
jgi:exosortase D (VPLPA-CTERM-specific)